MEFDFGEDAPPDLCLKAAQLQFKLLHGYFEDASDRAALVRELTATLVDNNMTHFAETVSAIPSIGVSIPAATLSKMRANNEETRKKLDEKLKDAQENHGDVEVMEAYKEMAQFTYVTDTKEAALESLDKVKEAKGLSTGQHIDNVLKKVLVGLAYMDLDILEAGVEETEKLLEQGGDWDRRNRLQVYKGFYYMLLRRFEDAAKCLLSVVATFTCTELCSYTEFIYYTIVVSIIALDRVEFKKQVIESSQVKAVYEEIDYLPSFVTSLQNTKYSDFLVALVMLERRVRSDRYLHEHCVWWVRELRVKAYAQFLEAFKSVTLEMMSYEFGVSEKFLDKELSRFIANNRIAAKIDKANGVVEGLRAQPVNNYAHFQEVIKHGDLLLNKVQQLSRLLGV